MRKFWKEKADEIYRLFPRQRTGFQLQVSLQQSPTKESADPVGLLLPFIQCKHVTESNILQQQNGNYLTKNLLTVCLRTMDVREDGQNTPTFMLLERRVFMNSVLIPIPQVRLDTELPVRHFQRQDESN